MKCSGLLAKARELGVERETELFIDDGWQSQDSCRYGRARSRPLRWRRIKRTTALLGRSIAGVFNFIRATRRFGRVPRARVAAWGGGFLISVGRMKGRAIRSEGAPTVTNDVDLRRRAAWRFVTVCGRGWLLFVGD